MSAASGAVTHPSAQAGEVRSLYRLKELVPIFFFQYEARPSAESEDYGQYGGAYVNCWVEADSESEAMQIAAKDIKENKWQVVAVEKESRVVTGESYLEDKTGLEYYQQAAIDGECYVYHRWPNEPQAEDAVH